MSVEIEPVAEAQLAAERHGARLLHEQRVGTGVDDPAVESFGGDDAAGAIGRFEHAHRHATALQLVGGRQARDAAADDGDVDERQLAVTRTNTSLDCSAHPSRRAVHVLREHLHVLDRRRRQDAVTEVEDVAGPSADARQDVVGVLRACAAIGPSSSVGSRFPWTARS